MAQPSSAHASGGPHAGEGWLSPFAEIHTAARMTGVMTTHPAVRDIVEVRLALPATGHRARCRQYTFRRDLHV
jgi:hypothetical protein